MKNENNVAIHRTWPTFLGLHLNCLDLFIKIHTLRHDLIQLDSNFALDCGFNFETTYLTSFILDRNLLMKFHCKIDPIERDLYWDQTITIYQYHYYYYIQSVHNAVHLLYIDHDQIMT